MKEKTKIATRGKRAGISPTLRHILSSAKFIADHSDLVSIDREQVERFARGFKADPPAFWLTFAPFNMITLQKNDQLNFLLAFDALSFCYWGDPKWTVTFSGKQYDGTWALVASIAKALQTGKPWLTTQYRATLPFAEFADLFTGEPEVPLLKERWLITQQIAQSLLKNFGGEFSHLVEASNHDASLLLDLILTAFPSFEDSSTYKKKRVLFYKRAQLLVSDVHQILQAQGEDGLTNTHLLTGFPDYKIPQGLRKEKILQYAPSLAEKVDNKIEIPKDSVAENEIRGNMVWATELIRQELEKNGRVIAATDIDHHLWLLSQNKQTTDLPYHRTRTTAY